MSAYGPGGVSDLVSQMPLNYGYWPRTWGTFQIEWLCLPPIAAANGRVRQPEVGFEMMKISILFSCCSFNCTPLNGIPGRSLRLPNRFGAHIQHLIRRRIESVEKQWF
jgi:hypothetical protein